MFLFRLFKAQTKKYLKTIPVALLSATVFLFLLFTILYSAIKLMPEDQPVLKASVGLVTNGLDDSTLKWGLRFLEGTESISEHLDFIIVDEDTGLKYLKNGKIIGLIVLPENILEGILYGYNYPATILFNKNNPLSNVILTELTRSGAGLLSGAQSSTYTTSEIYQNLGLTDQLDAAFYDVDIIGLKYALRRQDSFYSEKTDNQDMNTLIIFYIFAAITLLLLITTISFTKDSFYDNDAFLFLGKRQKGFNILYPCGKILSLSFIYFITLLLFKLISLIIFHDEVNIFNIELKLNNNISLGLILTLLLISLFLSAFSHMLIFMTDSILDGILLTFITTIILVFISGMIIPVSFMPAIFSSIQLYSPVTALQNALTSVIMDVSFEPLYLCIYTAICIIIAIASFSIRTSKKV